MAAIGRRSFASLFCCRDVQPSEACALFSASSKHWSLPIESRLSIYASATMSTTKYQLKYQDPKSECPICTSVCSFCCVLILGPGYTDVLADNQCLLLKCNHVFHEVATEAAILFAHLFLSAVMSVRSAQGAAIDEISDSQPG